MKSRTPSVFLVLLLGSVLTAATARGTHDYAAQVNPFIGTAYTGNTYPGAQAPFGMVQLSPDNGTGGWHRIAGYYYPDSTIAGFSHTHLSGTGAGDLYDISFLPVILPYSEDKTSALGIHSTFSHADEQASAGYYSVRLKDYGIRVELTATPRTGIQRYTFPEGQAVVILNLAKAMNWDRTCDSHIEVVDSCTLRGYRYSSGWAADQRVYFVSRFSRPFRQVKYFTEGIGTDAETSGKAEKAFFHFGNLAGEPLTVCTALSGVSMEGAARNLQAEAPHSDFDRYRAESRRAWNALLGRIAVKGGSRDERTCFYTALYRSQLAPTLFCDVDGAYRGPDKQVHRAEGWTNYTTFSLWDTFRAAHPLYTVVAPERVADMVRSLLAFEKQNGRLPVWNLWGNETDMMIGYHAVPVIVDACLKGIGGIDAEQALAACVRTAQLKSYRDIGAYMERGYVPADADSLEGGVGWSLSRTLEYAYDDYCISLLAGKLGHQDLAVTFARRAQHYRNLFNPATGFFQPRRADGSFVSPFHPDDYTRSICESNAWHYLWSVPHDVEGLMELLGGRRAMTARLDTMFARAPRDSSKLPLFSTGMIGQYVHGNEPCHHVAYLYNAVGEPARTQRYVSQIVHTLYANRPDGLCGNEDCGQMSAWYVWSALGLYPVNPVGGRYELGTPLFPEARLSLPDGKVFRVVARGVSRRNCYVQSVKVNGRPYRKSFITHRQLMDGITLEFEMGSRPARPW